MGTKFAAQVYPSFALAPLAVVREPVSWGVYADMDTVVQNIADNETNRKKESI